MITSLLTCAIIGYLLGCLSPSYIIGRLNGYDVRKDGSGNAGASNTVMLAGKAAGLFVALFDIAKAYFACKLATSLFPQLPIVSVFAGACCAIGHMFPFTLGFRGGKAFACLGGIILAFHSNVFFLFLCAAVFLAFITDYVCISACAMWTIYPLYYGYQTGSLISTVILAVPAGAVYFRHIENFRRIRAGKEMRFSFLYNRSKEIERIGVDRSVVDRFTNRK